MSVIETDMAEARQRSLRVFPGGSNGEFNLPPELCTVISRGKGCELVDTSGATFLDFSIGWGSALVGHARPEVTEAVIRQAELGANFAYVNENSLALAEEICRLSAACERVRFCASGTEATMYCQRLARAATGRSKILKFEGAYHGSNEVGVTSLFPQRLLDFPEPEPSSAGIPPAVMAETLVAPYNDTATATRIIAEHAAELAAVIVEPLQRCTPPEEGFLESLRSACTEHDVLLIFDEVVTGFRLAYAGAQEYYGVIPDLIAYGKALGGGYPIGAFGGRADIMDRVREDRLGEPSYVWVASTLGGNPISTAAARAALDVFRQPGCYRHLHDLGKYLRDGMRGVLEEHQEQAQIIGDGPLAQVVFSAEPVNDYRSTARADRAKGRALMLALFRRKIFLNPMGTKLYLSLAHTDGVCDMFLERFSDALQALKLGRE
ncbi:MAG: aminotransferase class III-fold pyridoxal phosphate-dependent enzyme [Gammaproteobacteria bacterium]|nr:aminotransferase class III-fold pyridoxal phosphate-dependent enzyme [Gammaproteobacteria bacterium]NIM73774.1 aminotransferase class III-fold pyridoxal phosphate-dependent enzyme [Gammaproteobacteria bacterium]NIN39351.1 aminotransferase class III-fold pyridoxal phosphate-dependent enzyme [Gammaproteobacteria bacterium]NIO25016.1 aminotransferase class III-fold pyridoxal phosphate-dependent enzyme [Gammaproteobacteria bacterium]NIO65648.1 aminotransferase class III-fold pyridoxal phosphate-